MSELRRFSRPRANRATATRAPSRLDALRPRLPLYAAVAAAVLLALAWIDGGEEPIRPIVQTIEAAGTH